MAMTPASPQMTRLGSQASGQTAARRSVGLRLAWATVAFCAVYIAFSVAVFSWMAWRDARARMEAELAQMEQAYATTLAKAIWELDRESLQNHVDSAAGVPSVGRVAVNVGLASQAPEVLEFRREGWMAPGWAPSRTLALAYEPYPGGKQSVGALHLQGDEQVLWQRLRGELASIMVAQLLQSLLLAGLVMGIFNRMVTVHIRRIAQHLARLRPDTLNEPLQLQRTGRSHDELSDLVEGVNQLQGSLSNYLEQQQRYEKELADHRDRLAQMVDARTIELQEANARLQGLARTDALTGLPNRRSFDEVQANEIRRARRNQEPLAFMIADIDDFKAYNDHYGHAMGDHCLCAVAHTLRASLGRAGDLVARLGGEEFSVLLPGAEVAAACLMAERLRQAVAGCGIEHAHSQAASVVTISIGLTVMEPGSNADFETLYQQADAALYRAKAMGRNRVECHVPPSFPTPGAVP